MAAQRIEPVLKLSGRPVPEHLQVATAIFLRYAKAPKNPDGTLDFSKCVLWQGPRNEKGYPRFRAGYRTFPVLRLSWQLHYWKEWPDGMVADHVCRVRACVNPLHLRPVTNFENTLIGEQGGLLFQRVLLGGTRKEWPVCYLDGRKAAT